MAHGHGQGTGVRHRGRLALVLALSLVVLAVEAVVGWITGSLALLADAGHVLGDSAGIVLASLAFPAEHWRQLWSNNPLEMASPQPTASA